MKDYSSYVALTQNATTPPSEGTCDQKRLRLCKQRKE